MRKVVNKSSAITTVILIIALMAILAIFPARLFTTTKTITGGGTICGSSEIINSGTDVVQRFVAAYDRIDNIEVNVTEVGGGRYFQVVLFNEQMQQIYSTYVDMGTDAVPGNVKIPMLVELNVNETYTIVISAALSSFRVAYEDIPGDSPYVRETAFHDTGIEGVHLAASYNYSVPLDKKISLGLIAGIAILAILLCLAVKRYYAHHPEKDHLITVERAVKYVGNPITAVILVTAMIMVFPLKKFTHIPRDIVFYEIGLLITGGLIFYGINHNRGLATEKPAMHFDSLWSKIAAIGQIILIALAIKYTSDYMNALYDIYHRLADRPMLVCLLGILLLMYPLHTLINVPSVIYLILSAICGRYYYTAHLMADTEKEYDLNNAVLKYTIIAVILTGWLVLCILRTLPGYVQRRKQKPKMRLSLFGVLFLSFLLLAVIFRGSRTWELLLALLVVAFAFSYAAQTEHSNWIRIVTSGILLNFICTVIWSMLYRPLAGYVMPRFSMQFHTVTVTAEYLTIMVSMAIVLLLAALYRVPKGSGIKVLAASTWKEFVLFGMSVAYMMLTMSRTIIASIAVTAVILLLVVERSDRKQKGEKSHRAYYFGRSLLVMILSACLMFPATFTMQRLVQTVVSRPYVFDIEDTVVDLRGGANWDNPSYLSVNRFINVFADRVLGIETSKENVPTDRFNYDSEGHALYDVDGQAINADGDVITAFSNPAYSEAAQEAAAWRQAIAEAEWEAEQAQEEAEEAARLEAEQAEAENGTDGDETAMPDDATDDNDGTDAEDSGDEDLAEDYTNGRMSIFRAYLDETNLTGHENMWLTLPSGEELVHAHNTYIQVIYDNGLITGILFLLLIFVALLRGFGYNKKNEQKIAAMPLGITLGFAVAALSEWVFHLDNPMTIALLLVWVPLMFQRNK